MRASFDAARVPSPPTTTSVSIDSGRPSASRRSCWRPKCSTTAPASLRDHAQLITTGRITLGDFERGDRTGGVEQLEVRKHEERDSSGHGSTPWHETREQCHFRQQAMSGSMTPSTESRPQDCTSCPPRSTSYSRSFRASPSSTSPDPSKCSLACPMPAACSLRSTAASSSSTRVLTIRRTSPPRQQSCECDLLCVPGGFGCGGGTSTTRPISAALRRLGVEGPLRHLGLHRIAAARGGRTCCAANARRATGPGATKLADFGVGPGRGVAWCATASCSPAAASPPASTWPSKSWRRSPAATCAETVQLAIEYAPAPPFDSGRPELAREPVLLPRARASIRCVPNATRPSDAPPPRSASA